MPGLTNIPSPTVKFGMIKTEKRITKIILVSGFFILLKKKTGRQKIKITIVPKKTPKHIRICKKPLCTVKVAAFELSGIKPYTL